MPNYVVDTSSLVNLRQYYPSAAFSALWDKLGSLAKAEKMIAPIQVYRELKSKDDELLEWAKQHKTMFKKNRNDEIKFAATLTDKYRAMRSTDSAVEKADPLVIAMAYNRSRGRLDGEWVVVTEEGDGSGQIPQILKVYKLLRYKLVDVILEEEWSFGAPSAF